MTDEQYAEFVKLLDRALEARDNLGWVLERGTAEELEAAEYKAGVTRSNVILYVKSVTAPIA